MIQHLDGKAVVVLIVDGSPAAQEGWQHAFDLFGVLFKATPLGQFLGKDAKVLLHELGSIVRFRLEQSSRKITETFALNVLECTVRSCMKFGQLRRDGFGVFQIHQTFVKFVLLRSNIFQDDHRLRLRRCVQKFGSQLRTFNPSLLQQILHLVEQILVQVQLILER
uniref:(northern house mosquito) hypothetical protein n=1 Tax=Culex pipiens TaxID=7175 RepID=A0A8D8IPP4_CULPI